MRSPFVSPADSANSAHSDPRSGDLIQFPSRNTPPPPSGSDGNSGSGKHDGRRPDRFRRSLFDSFGAITFTVILLAFLAGDSSSSFTGESKIGEQRAVVLPYGARRFPPF